MVASGSFVYGSGAMGACVSMVLELQTGGCSSVCIPDSSEAPGREALGCALERFLLIAFLMGQVDWEAILPDAMQPKLAQ